MNLFYLTKATVLCGGSAFVIYSFPFISQAVIIGLLTLLWMSCAHRTLKSLRQQRLLQRTNDSQ
jgi:uncharacterized membrane protein YesL